MPRMDSNHDKVIQSHYYSTSFLRGVTANTEDAPMSRGFSASAHKQLRTGFLDGRVGRRAGAKTARFPGEAFKEAIAQSCVNHA